MKKRAYMGFSQASGAHPGFTYFLVALSQNMITLSMNGQKRGHLFNLAILVE